MSLLFLHVDDIAVFGRDVASFKAEISREFDMKDLGEADLLLGIEIHHQPDAVVLLQRHLDLSLLNLYGMTNCCPCATSLVPNVHLDSSLVEQADRFKALGVNYRSAIGALSYLSTATRPDISFAVSHLSQFLENPGIQHWEGFTHVLRYLRGTCDYALIYRRDSIPMLCGFTDANWGNCLLS